MSTQVILLQRVENLGNMGDVVSVKPGYARNYLLPQNKALRASKDNVAYFEAQKKHLEAESDKQKKEAEKVAKKIEGVKVPMIRAASESGTLFGSVATRDIAAGIAETTGEAVTRSMVSLNTSFKQLGLFPVAIYLHPEVKVEVIINIARTKEEAEIQAETGVVMVADAQAAAEAEAEAAAQAARDEAALADVLEDGALEAEKTRQADAAEKDAAEAVKAEERAAKKAEKDAAKAAAKAAEEAAEGDAPEGEVVMGATEE
jgi:large subunit ribosomal protein L9